MLVKMTSISENLPALVTLVRLLFGSRFFVAMHPSEVERQTRVSVHVLLANVASVGGYPQMPPHMFHKQAHVTELIFAHATLELGVLFVRLGDIDVLEHFALLLEQDVVNGTHHLAVVNQSMGLHVLASLEFHFAFWALDARRTMTAFFQMVPHGGAIFLQLATLHARDVGVFDLFAYAIRAVMVLQMDF